VRLYSAASALPDFQEKISENFGNFRRNYPEMFPKPEIYPDKEQDGEEEEGAWTSPRPGRGRIGGVTSGGKRVRASGGKGRPRATKQEGSQEEGEEDTLIASMVKTLGQVLFFKKS
jgi:hypothetical protein